VRSPTKRKETGFVPLNDVKVSEIIGLGVEEIITERNPLTYFVYK
jgi:hypothetical protein